MSNYSVSKISPVVLALADWMNRKKISHQDFYNMKMFGFILSGPNGWEISKAGMQALHENGLVFKRKS